ncbi:MAG: HNH endonuclease [Candidatus Aquicultor sp.]
MSEGKLYLNKENIEYENKIMREIKLTQGKIALVDDEDYEYLNQFKWFCSKQKYTCYAVRSMRMPDGNYRTLAMHRAIMGTLKGKVVDHIDHNGLNNQKYNLRNCTHAENLMNQSPAKSSGSIYKGVSLYPGGDGWRAIIRKDNKQHFIGRFTKEIEAARAYNQKAIEYFGEYALLNQIN